MSDALQLPPRPNLEQYRKLAKDFQSACKSSDPGAIRGWAARWAEKIARLQNAEIAPETQTQIERTAQRIEQRWLKFQETKERSRRCMLADAQFFIAREHGFASWPKFAGHIEALARADTPVSQFEAAADAIVSGDRAALENLLRETPDLVRTRSTREHRSTLLHYVSANGIEDFRQRTPKNIVEIAEALLKAGADANAESDAYGGRSTPLGLTATSWHPENAGLQLPLMELLIAHGARIDAPDGGGVVNSCLRNGRGFAAEFLASRGARLDLEGAAGVGRIEVVRSFFADDGTLKAPATQQQLQDGFAWACEFGRTNEVDFLLQKGIDIRSISRHNGQTGLHWAAYGGYTDIVRLLLDHGAPTGRKDEIHGGTPLGWALHAWGNMAENQRVGRGSYYQVVALLVRAGAELDPRWRLPSDPRMRAALRGETPPRRRFSVTG